MALVRDVSQKFVREEGLPWETKTDHVGTESLAWNRMNVRSRKIYDLLGGTEAMRRAGRMWLPQFHSEDDEAYWYRLERSILFNAFEDTLEKLVSKPFSREITLPEDIALSDVIRRVWTDTTMMRTTPTQFFKQVFRAGVGFGLTFVYVDYPAVSKDLSLEEERRRNIRPYFVHIAASNVIGGRSLTLPSGRKTIQSVRIRETRTERKGAYGEVIVEYIREIMGPQVPDSQEGIELLDDFVSGKITKEQFIEEGGQLGWIQLWKKKAGDENEKTDDDQYEKVGPPKSFTFPGIPLIPYYTKQVGDFEAESPMEALAWLNIAHWQSLSDQRNILTISRFAILFQSGVSDEDLEKKVTIGPTRMIRTSNENGDLKYVEHTGAAISSGERDIQQLEHSMERLGLDPMVKPVSHETATGRVLDNSKTHSSIQSWVRELESVMVECFHAAALWVGEELSEDFKPDIFNDFGITLRSERDIEMLINARNARMLDIRTTLEEFRRRGLIGENVSVEEAIKALEEEEEKRIASLLLQRQTVNPVPPGGDADNDGKIAESSNL